MSKIIRTEQASTINGVEGRAHNVVAWDGQNNLQTLANQKWSASREISGEGFGVKRARLTVEIRFDDNCRNGHNSFAITGNIDSLTGKEISGGCIHDEIAKAFPELQPFIKWHLMATDGPMHYIANTVYHASDRDHSGLAKGEASSFSHGIRFGNSPITKKLNPKFSAWIKARMAFNGSTAKTNPEHGEFRVAAIAYDGKSDHAFGPKYTTVGFGETWYDCPFDNEKEAQEFAQALNTLPVEFVTIPTAFSEGKERDLNAARSTAIWPDATDEQLSLPKAELTALLAKRLPQLIAEFRADMDKAGFIWSAE